MGMMSAAVRRDNQYEVPGNAYGTGNLKRGPSGRQVANRAIDRTAAELDRSGFKHPKPLRSAILVHDTRLQQAD